MPVSSVTLGKLLGAGVSGDALLDIVASIDADFAGATKTRSAGALRQQRYRERKTSQTVTRNVTSDVTALRNNLPPKENSPAPPKEITPIPASEANASSSGANRAVRLPLGFEPDEAWAVRQGLSPQQARAETAKFRDYWNAKGGRDAAKRDWPATWRNWARTAAERLPRGSPARGGGRLSAFEDAKEQLRREVESGFDEDATGGPEGDGLQNGSGLPRLLAGH